MAFQYSLFGGHGRLTLYGAAIALDSLPGALRLLHRFFSYQGAQYILQMPARLVILRGKILDLETALSSIRMLASAAFLIPSSSGLQKSGKGHPGQPYHVS